MLWPTQSYIVFQSEDLLWNDYEEKINDQVVHTMENYTSQFPDVKVLQIFYILEWIFEMLRSPY